MTARLFDPQSLAIDTTLAGRALPSPRRRMAAFAIDYALLLLPTMATALLFAGLALALLAAGFRRVLRRRTARG